MSEIEVPLGFVKQSYVYKIPPARTTRGHKASDWDLENPINKTNPFSVHVVERNGQCIIKLTDPSNNDSLFVECVYTKASVEKTLDSSRYFVLTPTDDQGRRAYMGLGFQERSEAFDFEQALLSFQRYQSSEAEIEEMKKQWEENKQDLSLKGGKIKINLPLSSSKKESKNSDNDDDDDSNINVFLPPPPGGAGVLTTTQTPKSGDDFFDQPVEWSNFDSSNNTSDDWTQF